MVVFYLDGTFNCNQDKLYNKRDLRDKSQICIITSQIETICYKNEGKFRTCECLSPALLSQEHDDRIPKLLWIPSTTNCTRAADRRSNSSHHLCKSHFYDFTMNDRDSFFRVSFVLIFMVNDPRHFF